VIDAAQAPNLVAAVIALINNLPAILTAIFAFAGAWIAIRNGKKTDRVGEQATEAAGKAQVAAVKADEAVSKAAEVHETTKTIATQTNGHLTQLTTELARRQNIIDGLQATIITLTGVLNARQVRRTDVLHSIAHDVNAIADDVHGHAHDDEPRDVPNV